MIRVRKATDRGYANHGWLETYHTFSFASYVDREHVHFRSLRVINDDKVASHTGFGTHPHDNMEIITYVMEGELTHKDSMGNEGAIRAGEFQMMHAGTGILHSEQNKSTERTHLYQIWVFPDQKGRTPGYDQRPALNGDSTNRLNLIVSPDGRDGTMQIYQDASLFLGKLDQGKTLDYAIADQCHAWVQVTKGQVSLNGIELSAGDGAAVSDETALAFVGGQGGGEWLLFDLS